MFQRLRKPGHAALFLLIPPVFCQKKEKNGKKPEKRLFSAKNVL
jgi:hypothetical protein